MSNMVVNTNVLALNSHRNLKGVGLAQGKASARLSSGMKINSAADDAAGLAISEKMRAQIRGLDMASKNSQDSISLIQTAEGGMQEIDNMLQRIRELTVQVSNDTNEHNEVGTGDRKKMQDEIDQLVSEIDSMAERTEFNKKKVINGEYSSSDNAVTAAENQRASYEKINAKSTTALNQADVSQKAAVNAYEKFMGLIPADPLSALGVTAADAMKAVNSITDKAIAANELLSGEMLSAIADVGGAPATNALALTAFKAAIVTASTTTASANEAITSDFAKKIADSDEKSGLDLALRVLSEARNGGMIDAATVKSARDLVGVAYQTALDDQRLALDAYYSSPDVSQADKDTYVAGRDAYDAARDTLVTAATTAIGAPSVVFTKQEALIAAKKTESVANATLSSLTNIVTDYTKELANLTTNYGANLSKGSSGLLLSSTVDFATAAGTDSITQTEGVSASDKTALLELAKTVTNADNAAKYTDKTKTAAQQYINNLAVSIDDQINPDKYGTGLVSGLAFDLTQGTNMPAITGGTAANLGSTYKAFLDAAAADATWTAAGEKPVATDTLDQIVNKVKTIIATAGYTAGVPKAAVGTISAATTFLKDLYADYAAKGAAPAVAATAKGKLDAHATGAYATAVSGAATAADDLKAVTDVYKAAQTAFDTANASSPIKGYNAIIAPIVKAAEGVDALYSTAVKNYDAAKVDYENLEKNTSELGTKIAAADNTLNAGELKKLALEAVGKGIKTPVEASQALNKALENDSKTTGLSVDNTDKDSALKLSLDIVKNFKNFDEGTVTAAKQYLGTLYTETNNKAIASAAEGGAWNSAQKVMVKNNQEKVNFELKVESTKKAYEAAVSDKATTTSNVALSQIKVDSAVSEKEAFDVSGKKAGLYFQVGANENQGLQMTIGSAKSDVLGIGDGQGNTNINVLEATGADTTEILGTLDKALSYVTSERSKLGAAQNRLEYTIKSLDISSENLSAAESRIRDTDMAKEMMNKTKTDVLSQAATAMLAKANQAPQNVLQLLQ